MGKRGNDTVKRSINFDRWMYNAIEEIASKKGMTLTSVVIELLRQELDYMGYSVGIGRDTPVFDKADIDKIEGKKEVSA